MITEIQAMHVTAWILSIDMHVVIKSYVIRC